MNTINLSLGAFDYRLRHEALARLHEKQIFFVGGVEKSGSSWLQYLFDAHPQVSCGGESHFADSLFAGIKKALEEHNALVLRKHNNPMRYELGGVPDTFDEADFKYIASSAILMSLLKQAPDKSPLAVGERTPYNVHAFAGLGNLFPSAKCIHIVRDPRDAGVSHWHMVRRTVTAEMQGRMLPMHETVKQFADLWIAAIQSGLQFAAMHPNRYCDLRYEDLISEPVPTLARLCRFLGVDDRSAVVKLCLDKASFARLSGGRAPGQEDNQSFFRKGIIGDWRNHLDAATNEHILAKAGELMRGYGYL
ncbi:MAG: sulfotransferase family protein [Stellaceae bacterium]